MSVTLQDYLNDTMRLLHDATNRFWTQAELIDYINKARKLTVAETGCTRQLATVNVIVATNLADASYAFDNGIVAGRRVIDVLDILLQYSSNTSFQLRYLPFSQMARTAVWQYQMVGTPQYYTVHNQTCMILQWPSQAYPNSIFDCIVEPVNLVNTTDIDNDIFFPFSECVGYYAAYLAKLKDQRREDAEYYFKDYQQRKMQAIGSQFTRRLVGK